MAFGLLTGTSENNLSPKILTLESFSSQVNFKRTVIKIDNESFEYEVILSSTGFLAKNRPSLQIGIHNQFILDRSLEPWKIYATLKEIEFKGIGKKGEKKSSYKNKYSIYM